MDNYIICATENEGKVREIRSMMEHEPVVLRSLKDIGIKLEVEENGDSFEENALIKARYIHNMTGRTVIADDSGLVVDYLDGEPGIYSARYMGEDTPYSVKNKNIIDRLIGVEDNDRGARFICAMAVIFKDGTHFVCRGVLEGRIGYKEEGDNGFGYDPIFLIDDGRCTTAQLCDEDKNHISHRYRALVQIIQLLKENSKII